MSLGAGMLLVLNTGSSSVKFALYAQGASALATQAYWRGQVSGFEHTRLVWNADGDSEEAWACTPETRYATAVQTILQRVRQRCGDRPLAATVHRVVHGGAAFRAPVRVDAQVLGALQALIPLAPLHQPQALAAIAAALAMPAAPPQIACFDTAFHHTLPPEETTLPLPAAVCGPALRRYGFHGLSYAWLAHILPQRWGARAHGRVLAAHLGSGASLCALQAGSSVATSMGFSALDGLMMGTRPGALDPGVLLHLQREQGLDLAALEQLLYRQSGLLGVSGLSADPRVLLAAEARTDAAGAAARLALAMYVRRIVREMGGLIAVLGGLDLLVFTAGVGEHSAELRARIVQALAGFGLQLDAEANARHAPCISTAASRVQVVIEAANEEWVAAQQALALLQATP